MTKSDQVDLEFYKRHYGGSLELVAGSREENAKYLVPGTRYWLASERIRERAKPDDLLVEAGCGDARLLIEIARRSSVRNVVGIDGAFQNATEFEGIRLLSHNLNERWPFDDGTVDHLMSMMVIEHLFDPFHSFAEIRRILAPHGRAYVNLPLVTSLQNRARLLAGVLPLTSSGDWFERREWDGGHLHYFSVSMIDRLARVSGLAIEESRGVGNLHRLKTMLPGLLASEITFSLRRA